jgi:hypothetical protein
LSVAGNKSPLSFGIWQRNQSTTVFVIDLASRRVQIAGVTPHPDEVFMRQVGRTLRAAERWRAGRSVRADL